MPDDALQARRRFFAELITANAGIADPSSGLVTAFASVPRERFAGPGPWRVFTPRGYITTPSGDPSFLYQDITVALKPESQINNGQPVLHAVCLAALNPRAGETAVHIGAGTGYYTAVIATLVGSSGAVIAYEIDAELAGRASANLADRPNVDVRAESGVTGSLPRCDAIYVNAGLTGPPAAWLDALRPGGRLLFPLTPAEIAGRPMPGGMLLVTRGPEDDRWGARFVCPAAFISAVGGRDDDTAARLTDAFRRGQLGNVRSLRRDGSPDESCWVAGRDWWLSTA
jgi:protein-L-isoaspartate(D-aspartate) O-methyltransferase